MKFAPSGATRQGRMDQLRRDRATAQVLRTLVASKVLGWKLSQTRDGYIKQANIREPD